MLNKLLCLMVLAACGDNTAPIANDARPPLTSKPRTIVGAASIVTTDETGHSTTVPLVEHVSVQFPRDDDWDVREVSSRPDGTFEIPDAPPGAYWIETDDSTGVRQFLWTNADALDFAQHAHGRGDAVLAAPGTTLTIGPVTKVSPVAHGDSFELVSGNLGLVARLTPPALGDTTLLVPRDWSQQPLVSAAAHDRMTLTQLRTSVAGTLTFKSPIASVAFDAFEQLDGANTVISGELAAPQDLTFALAWNRSEFAVASRDINPGVGPASQQSVFVRTQPGATVLAIEALAGETDLAQPLALKNPYAEGPLSAAFSMAFPVTIDAFDLEAELQVATADLPSVDQPIVPLVAPVLAPAIAGQDLFADHDGVGVTPSLTWSLPARGAPAAYTIVIEQVGAHDITDVATLVVPGDLFHARIPAGVLVAGQRYFLRIAAIAEPNIDVRRQSLTALGLPLGYADLYTGTFTP